MSRIFITGDTHGIKNINQFSIDVDIDDKHTAVYDKVIEIE